MSRISPRGTKRAQDGASDADEDAVDEVEDSTAEQNDRSYQEEQQNGSGRSSPHVHNSASFTPEQACYLVRLRMVELKDLHGEARPKEYWSMIKERLREKFGKSFVKSTAQVHEKWRNLEKCYRARKRAGKMNGAVYQLIDSLTSGNDSNPEIQTEGGESVTVLDICSLPNNSDARNSSRKSAYKRQRTPAPSSSMLSYAGLPYSTESNHVVYQPVQQVEAAVPNESLVEVLSTLKALVSNQERLLQQQERLLIHQERILTTQDNTAILQQSVASSFAVITSLLSQRGQGNTSGTSSN